MPWIPFVPADPKETAYLSVKLVAGGPRCPAMVEYRDGIWVSFLNGEQHGEPVDDAMAAGGFIQGWRSVKHIDKAEYDFMLARYRHAMAHDPQSPFCNPSCKIDLLLLPVIGTK